MFLPTPSCAVAPKYSTLGGADLLWATRSASVLAYVRSADIIPGPADASYSSREFPSWYRQRLATSPPRLPHSSCRQPWKTILTVANAGGHFRFHNHMPRTRNNDAPFLQTTSRKSADRRRTVRPYGTTGCLPFTVRLLSSNLIATITVDWPYRRKRRYQAEISNHGSDSRGHASIVSSASCTVWRTPRSG